MLRPPPQADPVFETGAASLYLPAFRVANTLESTIASSRAHARWHCICSKGFMQSTEDRAGPFEQTFATPHRSHVFSTVQGLALLLLGVTVMVPVVAYVHFGFDRLFGYPKIVLLAVVTTGAAVSMVLGVQKGLRLVGLITGALMGAGCAGAVIFANEHFANLLHIYKLGKAVLLFVMLLGAFPGLGIWARLASNHRKAKTNLNDSDSGAQA
jgi:cation transport ATPase